MKFNMIALLILLSLSNSPVKAAEESNSEDLAINLFAIALEQAEQKLKEKVVTYPSHEDLLNAFHEQLRLEICSSAISDSTKDFYIDFYCSAFKGINTLTEEFILRLANYQYESNKLADKKSWELSLESLSQLSEQMMQLISDYALGERAFIASISSSECAAIICKLENRTFEALPIIFYEQFIYSQNVEGRDYSKEYLSYLLNSLKVAKKLKENFEKHAMKSQQVAYI